MALQGFTYEVFPRATCRCWILNMGPWACKADSLPPSYTPPLNELHLYSYSSAYFWFCWVIRWGRNSPGLEFQATECCVFHICLALAESEPIKPCLQPVAGGCNKWEWKIQQKERCIEACSVLGEGIYVKEKSSSLHSLPSRIGGLIFRNKDGGGAFCSIMDAVVEC